jgi:hypothetical protein
MSRETSTVDRPSTEIKEPKVLRVRHIRFESGFVFGLPWGHHSPTMDAPEEPKKNPQDPPKSTK